MTLILPSMKSDLRVIVVGSTGGIGSAFIDILSSSEQVAQIYALSRQGKSHSSPKVTSLIYDFTDEQSIDQTTEVLRETGQLDICINATGLLQGDGISPEKNMRSMSLDAFQKSFMVNTFGPAMTAKSFLPLMRRDSKTVMATLTARVGSISDNRIGGWYSYRASKAALNMIIKTLSIEFGRRFINTIIIGLHPGTVDTNLSKPFQGNVPEGKLFTPEFSAECLLKVIDQVSPEDSGLVFAWDGTQVPF